MWVVMRLKAVFFYDLIFIIFSCTGSVWLHMLSPVAVSRGYSLVLVCRPLIE